MSSPKDIRRSSPLHGNEILACNQPIASEGLCCTCGTFLNALRVSYISHANSENPWKSHLLIGLHGAESVEKFIVAQLVKKLFPLL
jgi:hypothetical protein